MKYTRQERLTIGRQICDGVLSVYDAAEEYGISFYTAREYLRTYKAFRKRNVQTDTDDAAGISCSDGTTDAGGAGAENEARRTPGDTNGSRQGFGGDHYQVYLRQLSRDQLEAELMEMKQREEQIRQLLGQESGWPYRVQDTGMHDGLLTDDGR